VERRGGEPVEQRRLVEVAHSVQPRGDPAAAEHLAGDLGVLPFPGIVEGGAPQVRREEQGGQADHGHDGDTRAAKGRH
jgi:hypothetical protein